METKSSPPRTEEEANPMLTEKQVAAYLGITPRHLYSWRMAGFIPYFKIGRAIRFRRAEVEAAPEGMRGGEKKQRMEMPTL